MTANSAADDADNSSHSSADNSDHSVYHLSSDGEIYFFCFIHTNTDL